MIDSNLGVNRTLYWKEELLFDLNNKSLLHYNYIKNSQIMSMNVHPNKEDTNKQVI